jgi:hypothetical protein
VAETGRESIPTWISFQAACELGLGQRWLLLKLKAGLVRWYPQDVHPPGASLDRFWQDPEPTFRPDGSWIKTMISQVPGDPMFDVVTVFGLEIALEDVLTALPSPPIEPEMAHPGCADFPLPVLHGEVQMTPHKVSRPKWLKAYLTEGMKIELTTKYDTVGEAAVAVNQAMEEDHTVDAYANARSIEPFLAGLYPKKSRM